MIAGKLCSNTSHFILTEKRRERVSAAVWILQERQELANEHTGRVCLVVLLSVISEILQPGDWGGMLAQAVRKKSFNLG